MLREDGNYTCMATNKYGTDVRDFAVIFNGETDVYEAALNTVLETR